MMVDMKDTTVQFRVAMYHLQLNTLVREAYNNGMILTVETEPVAPLAMGSYGMRSTARARRDMEGK